MLSGGYFTNTNWAGQHNVSAYAIDDPSIALNVTPGGGAALNRQIECEDCHASPGHHATGGAYRLLSFGGTDVTGTGAANYGVGAGSTRGNNTYNAPSINAFCGSCHPNFHGTGDGAANLGSYTSGWIRHPVNITLADADTAATSTYDYTNNYGSAAVAADHELPLGDTPAGTIMCLTCHFPHGSGNLDILSFSYTGVQAGDNTRDNGCETCHNYGVTEGM